MKYYLFTIMMLSGFFSCKNETKDDKITNPAGVTIDKDSLSHFVISSADITLAEAKKRLTGILSTVENDSLQFKQVTGFLTTPLSDPNSRFRNEDLFIRLLEAKLKSPWFTPEEKSVVQGKLWLALQNQVGKPANDFTYFTPAGTPKKMYSINAPYTLLYFYNPECHSCIETKAKIQASPAITQSLQNGKLKLFAIYTDLDEALWRRHLPENPKWWLNGRDTGEYLWRNKIYDLQAIPSMYLLDEKKMVLLKDATIEQVEEKMAAYKCNLSSPGIK